MTPCVIGLSFVYVCICLKFLCHIFEVSVIIENKSAIKSILSRQYIG